MKKIKSIHDFIRFLAKRSRANYISSEQIDDAIHKASMDLFNYCYGLRETHQNGRPVSMVNYNGSQKIIDDLRPFITAPISITLTSGIGNIPEDYVHWSMIETTNNDKTVEIKVVEDAKWNSRINRIVAAPSTKSPVCRIYSNKIEFRPTTLEAVKLTYLKKPTKAIYAYDVVEDRPVYNDDDSTDIEWGEENHMDIISRALKYLGIYTEDDTINQYAQYKVETGK